MSSAKLRFLGENALNLSELWQRMATLEQLFKESNVEGARLRLEHANGLRKQDIAKLQVRLDEVSTILDTLLEGLVRMPCTREQGQEALCGAGLPSAPAVRSSGSPSGSPSPSSVEPPPSKTWEEPSLPGLELQTLRDTGSSESSESSQPSPPSRPARARRTRSSPPSV